jgi:asparagine synthase (glutamine-hydrolysing)
MCGIVGLVDTGRGLGPDRLRTAVIAMRDSLAHRGPDDQGVWVDPAGVCGLGHRRLSILDLSPLGHQPMADDSGQVAITFNGEIYNYRELAADLESQGARFKGQSDTEVLLALLTDLAPAHLNALRGMYGLAVWNGYKRQLLLARDPFGKKPLYLARGRGFFAFASEMQALELLRDLNLRISPDGLTDYLTVGYAHTPHTIYQEVEKLAPGYWALLSQPTGLLERAPFWQFAAGSRMPQVRLATSYEGRVQQLAELVEEAVKRRLISDVPVGAFLSGGVDSSLVVAIMKRLGARTRTFSVGFADTEDTEHIFARQVADHLGTEHADIVLKPDAIELAPIIAAALDEPNGDTSCLPTYLLCRFTRRAVTVALSGDGGDELFGGYTRYLDVLTEGAQEPARRPAGWTAVSAYLGCRWTIFQSDQIKTFLGSLTPSREALLRRATAVLQSSDRALIHRMRNLDVEHYLPGAVLAKVDRMSMQFALEVRCPLLDVDVAAFAAALSAEDCLVRSGQPVSFQGKRILKDVLSRFLPDEIVHRRKMGFGLPMSLWNPQALRTLATEVLDSRSTKLTDHVDRKALRQWLAWQQKPAHFSIYRLWPLLILELWLRKRRPESISL